jgi:hypothetical protein
MAAGLEKLQAPDISQLARPVLGQHLLGRLLLGTGSNDRKASAYVTCLITVTDKAVREYNLGRERLLIYAASANNLRMIIEGLGHFETCINSVKRALRFVERLAAHSEGPEVDRVIRRLLESYGEAITPLRNAVEHMDEYLASGELRDGAYQILAIDPYGEFLEVADQRLRLSDLATLLCRLNSLASECASFKEAAPGG